MLDLHTETLPAQVEPDQIGDRPLVLDDQDEPLRRINHGTHHAVAADQRMFEQRKAAGGECRMSSWSQSGSPPVTAAAPAGVDCGRAQPDFPGYDLWSSVRGPLGPRPVVISRGVTTGPGRDARPDPPRSPNE
ncbi:hypothetical protein Are01nite_52500 [Actinoplanes regularis]|nr:hypothetical protein Are01nite_52500 [Actinoplanes regularis]